MEQTQTPLSKEQQLNIWADTIRDQLKQLFVHVNNGDMSKGDAKEIMDKRLEDILTAVEKLDK